MPSPEFILPPIDLSTLKYDFFEALKAVTFDGKKMTRLEWNDNRLYGVLLNGQLVLHKPDAEYEFYPWAISDGDLFGTDWVILP